MTTLDIRRLDARYRLRLEEVHEVPRLDRALHRLAEQGLDRALCGAGLPAGEWCLRRLEVPVHIRLRDPEHAIEEQWGAAVADALHRALDPRSADVAYYPTRRCALIELVGQTAVGRADRAWAWERVGVRSPADPSPVSAPTDAILAALCRAPQDALVVVIEAARVVGLAALDRALGPDGWLAVVEILRAATGGDGQSPWRGGHATAQARRRSRNGTGGLSRFILASSRFAETIRRSRLRVDAERASAWAVLAALEVDPSVLRRASGDEILADVTAALASAGRSTAGTDRARATHQRRPTTELTAAPARGVGDARMPEIPGEGRVEPATSLTLAAPRAPITADASDAPEDEIGARAATGWAGLLFLHNVAEAIGLPEVAIDDPVLDARPVRWVLHAIAGQLLPIAPDDPAALALAGLGPADPVPAAQVPPATARELERIRDLASAWAAAAGERLGERGDPLQVVPRVAGRSGEIRAFPGWLDVHLRLGDVDVAIRRAGLDLDPGWIPWLGCVMRFVYE
jgi:hypothetical protein